jgi:menaquinone-9 beta-reductase
VDVHRDLPVDGGTARSRDADIIVVGAGPAGATTAMLLAARGLHVLLLDRQAFPRPKACGDCLSAGATTLLGRLGLLDDVLALPHARLRGWRLVSPAGSTFAADFPRQGGGMGTEGALAVERLHLDALLVGRARLAGAELRERTRVLDVVRDADGRIAGVATAGGILRAPLVVGADGLRSIVARRAGAVRRRPRLRKVSFTLHLDQPMGDADVGEMHVGDGFCAGVAPVVHDGSRFNLTVVAGSVPFGRDAARDPRALITQLISRLPALAGRIDPELVAAADLLASGPFDRPVRGAGPAGAALAGDAAGYFDPFTGQGVFQALAGAELLAAAVCDAVAGGRPADLREALRLWARRHDRLVRGTRRVQHLVEGVVSRPWLADRVFSRLRHAPGMARTLIAVTGDIAPARRLISPRVLSSLLLPE